MPIQIVDAWQKIWDIGDVKCEDIASALKVVSGAYLNGPQDGLAFLKPFDYLWFTLGYTTKDGSGNPPSVGTKFHLYFTTPAYKNLDLNSFIPGTNCWPVDRGFSGSIDGNEGIRVYVDQVTESSQKTGTIHPDAKSDCGCYLLIFASNGSGAGNDCFGGQAIVYGSEKL